MSFPAYSNYRNSGVDWLGPVPSHWDVRRLGGLFTERREKVSDTEFPPLSVTKHGVVPQLDTAAKTDDNDNRKCVLIGDFVINSRSDRKGSSGLSPLDGSVSLINTVITPIEYLDPAFLHYLLRSEPFQEEFYRYGKGIVADLWSTNFSEMKNIVLTYPDKREQAAIAGFLDRETAKIDALVEDQQRLIALLKEKRQAVISHAVTKGLNPDALMKDSNIEWFGEVPAHWRISPLMRLTAPGRHIMYGIVLPGPDVGEGGIPIVKGGDVKPHRLKLELLNRTTQEIELPFARARLRPLDIVYSIRGSIGDAEEVPDELEGANITQDAARISPGDDAYPRWLLYVMRSKRTFAQLEQRSLGAAVRGINIYDLKRAIVAVPPHAEQREIAAFLDVECSRLDELSAAASRGVELLQERRAALISAAVTGKIDVRGAANVLPLTFDRAHARGLIAAEIIERSAPQPTFGRVKLQKIAYLAEAHAGVTELEGAYLREAAGPLDREMIHEMEREAGKLAGVRVEQPGGAGAAVSYRLGNRRGVYRKDLAALLGDRATEFDKLIDAIGTLDTKGAEAVATLYAVWNDALIDGEAPADMEIKLAVLTEWHPEKAKKFRFDELQIWLDWMRRHSLVPTGTGPKTSTGRLFA